MNEPYATMPFHGMMGMVTMIGQGIPYAPRRISYFPPTPTEQRKIDAAKAVKAKKLKKKKIAKASKKRNRAA